MQSSSICAVSLENYLPCLLGPRQIEPSAAVYVGLLLCCQPLEQRLVRDRHLVSAELYRSYRETDLGSAKGMLF